MTPFTLGGRVAEAHISMLALLLLLSAPAAHCRALLHATHAEGGPQPFLESYEVPTAEYVATQAGGQPGNVSATAVTQLVALVRQNAAAAVSSSSSSGTSLSADDIVDYFGDKQRDLDDAALQQAALAVLACEATAGCQISGTPAASLEELAGSSSTQQQPSNHAMNIIKGVGAAALFIEALVGVLIPLFASTSLAAFQPGSLLLSLLNCFAGGVFLSFGIMHFIPDALEANDSVLGDSYPLGALLVVVGFLVVFFVQRVLAPLLTAGQGPAAPVAPKGCCSSVPIPRGLTHPEPKLAGEAASSGSDCESLEKPVGCTNCGCDRDVSPQTAALFAPNAAAAASRQGRRRLSTKDWVAPLVLWFGICVHALLEGMGMGLQTTRSGTVTVLVGLAVHKWVESLALSSRLSAQGASIWEVLLVLLPFAITVPLGVGIGVALTSVSDWITLVFFGIIAGAFIYIGMEILLDDFTGPLATTKAKLRRGHCFAAAFLGLVAVGCIQIYPS